MGLSPNTISVAIVAFRPESLQNFSAYIPYKPQNLFSGSVTKFYDFTDESVFGDRPLKVKLYTKINFGYLKIIVSEHNNKDKT